MPLSGEVLERLKGMEQQVQVALLELKKKDQQLARERSSFGNFQVRLEQKPADEAEGGATLCSKPSGKMSETANNAVC